MPPPDLSATVVCTWVHRVDGAAGEIHRTAPTGSVELVCRLGGVVQVRGPSTAPSEERLPAGARVLGVRFRPEAARVVLGLPPSGLAGRVIPLGDLWGPPGRHLAVDVADQTLEGARRAIVQAVAARLRGAPGPDVLIGRLATLLASGRAPTVHAAAVALHLSQRQLHRRCLAATGLGPKSLQRVLRFQRFLALAARTPDRSVALSQLAAAAGYADQPHLVHESHRLAGSAPGELLDGVARRCRGRHDHRATHRQLLGEGTTAGEVTVAG